MAILSPTNMQTIELGATGWRIIVNNNITYLNGFIQSITASGSNPNLYAANINASGSLTVGGNASITGTVSAANATASTNLVPLGQLQNGSLSLTVAFLSEPGVATSAVSPTTLAINCNTTKITSVTALANALTISNPTGTPVDGQKLIIRIRDSGTAQTLTFGSAYSSGTALPLPTTTTAGVTLHLGFIYNAALSLWSLVASIGV